MSLSFKHLVIIFVCLIITTSIFATPRIPDQFKSLVLPGWGELSNDNKSGYIFLATEIFLWSSRFYFVTESNHNINQSKHLAYTHANLSTTDLNDALWDKIARYDRSGFGVGGYNAHIVSQSMSIQDPVRREQFLRDNLLPDGISWEWGSDTMLRREFRYLRSQSMVYTEYALAVTGTIILNHIASFINTSRIVRSRDTNVAITTGFDREMRPMVMGSIRF